VPALPLDELGGCLGRWAKGGTKIQLCGSESEERTPKKGMNMIKVYETHDHAVYEKIKVLVTSLSVVSCQEQQSMQSRQNFVKLTAKL